MLKRSCIILGVGLLVMWIPGLGSPTAPGWLTWLDGVGAFFTFIVSGSGSPYTDPYAVPDYGVETAMDVSMKSRLRRTFGISAYLFMLWIVAASTGAVAWMTWWTFAFACAFSAVGLAEMTKLRNRKTLPSESPKDVDEVTPQEFKSERDRLREQEEERIHRSHELESKEVLGLKKRAEPTARKANETQTMEL